MEKLLLNPYVMGAFGATMALGLLIIGITLVLFRFLRKRIAEEIMGIPAPGSPDYTGPTLSKCPWPCQEHKGIRSELDEVEKRQKKLREEDLPDMPEKYPTRREYDACKKTREEHEGNLFARVGLIEQKVGEGGKK